MRNPASMRARPEPEELLSIAERMRYTRILRAGFVVIVLAVGALAPSVRGVSLRALVGATGLYALLLLAPGVIRRFPGFDARPLLNAILLLDGVYLAWVVYATGGTGSPLRFLIYVHVVAVTLIVSYLTGLKIAGWHALLFFVMLYGQSGGILQVKETVLSALPGGNRFQLVSTLSVFALWVVAVATAWLSAANERDLRGQKIDLEQLSQTVAEFDARTSAADIPRILLDKVCEVFGFARGVVLASPKDDLTLMAYRGPGPPIGVPPGLDHVMERAWDGRRTVLVRKVDPEQDPRLAALLPGGRNLLIVPLFLDRGYRLGILALERGGKDDRMKRWTVAMVEQFASHAAIALHNSWLVDEIKEKLEENKVLEGELYAQNLALETKVQERTREVRQSLESLQIVDAQRRALLSRLVNAEEEQRQRIAGDVHDGPIQQMVAASLELEIVRKRLAALGQRELNAKVAEALTAVSSSVEGMRTLIFELHPMSLDEEGLAAALREYRRNLGPDLEFIVDDRLRHEPTRETRVILYRIAQEALVNVRKHAKATRVEVLLEERRGGYLVRVQDNGVGFNADETRSRNGHLGLSSMKERADMAGGKCEIRRRPEGGTSVEFWLPEKAAQALTKVDRRFAQRGAA